MILPRCNVAVAINCVRTWRGRDTLNHYAAARGALIAWFRCHPASTGTKDAGDLAICGPDIIVLPACFTMNYGADLVDAVAAVFQEAGEPEAGVMIRVFRVQDII